MKIFDVVIVGAGPAGGQCARKLAQKGHRVLLVEQHINFQQNNFSSAGSVLSILKDYELPESVVGSYWNRLDVVTTKNHYRWHSENNQGVVLDFAKLRQCLTDQASQHGATVWMHHKYVGHEQQGDLVTVNLLNRTTKQSIVIQTKILVDATGPQHSIINRNQPQLPRYNIAFGLEYLIRADNQCHHPNTLTFLLGDYWMPKGYAWVFPMESGVYKVGVGAYITDAAKGTPSLAPYVKQLIRNYLQIEHYELIDKHGGVLRYCTPEHEQAYDGNIVAIGDALSCVNALGGEGIRHGMYCANLAAHYIDLTLYSGKSHFAAYRKAVLRKFNKTWKRCDAYAKAGYQLGTERKLDLVFGYLQKLPLPVIVDVLFHYRFGWLKWLLFKRLIKKLLRPLKKVIATVPTTPSP